MKLTIQTLEGGGDSSVLGCYVTVDSHLYDIITPLGPDTQSDAVDIPPHGLLRLAVRFMGREDRLLGSVSLPISLLKEGKDTWLPLKHKTEGDLLSSLSLDCKPPRIQVKVGSESRQELRTGGGSMPQLPFIDSGSVSPGPKQSTFIQERQKMRIQKQTSVIEDLNRQIADLRLYLSKQAQQETQWRKLYSEVTSSAEAAVIRTRNREETMGRSMKEMQEKLRELMEENGKLRRDLMVKESEGYQLMEENRGLKTQIVMLKGEGEALGRGDWEDRCEEERKGRTDDFLDLALSEFFLRQQVPITKVSSGVYMLGQERFMLSFRSGMLVVKTKPGYLLLSEYLRTRNIPVPKDEELIVEFPATKAMPTVRALPSPIQYTANKTEQTAESDADSTFQTDISNLIKELEFDPSNPMRKQFQGPTRLKDPKVAILETSKASKKQTIAASPRMSVRRGSTK